MTDTASRRNPAMQRGGAAKRSCVSCVTNGAAVAGLVITLLCFSPPAAAITINLIQAPDNLTDHPDFDSDLSKLAPIVQAAADYWESILLDNHEIDIYFRYQDLDNAVWGISNVLSDDGQRPTEGLVSFDTIVNTAVPFERNWYFDLSPLNHSEFDMQQVLVRDLTASQQSMYYNGSPPGLLEAGFWGNYSDMDLGDDLFTTAVHEFGHILGVTNSLPDSAAELADGDYDFNPSFVNGANVAAEYWDIPGEIEPEHLRSPDALMSVGAGSGNRHLPGATDIFAAAAVAGWSAIDLPRMDYLGGTVWDLGGNWEGGTIPDSNDDVYVRHGGDVSVLLNSVAGDLTIRDGSSVTTNDNTLAVTDDVTIEAAGGDDAGLTVENGGLLTADDIHVGDGGRLFTAGSIFSTAVDADSVNIHAGGLLFGTGRVQAQSISNSGTVTALASPASTMNVLALDAGAGGAINLDGSGNEGEAQLFAVLASILVSGPLTDPFDGEITVGAERAIFFDEPWTFGAAGGAGTGTIHLDGGANVDTAATINTDVWTAARGQINVSGFGQIVGTVIFGEQVHVDVDTGGFLVLSGNSTFDGGTYTGGGTIRFDGPTTIDGSTTMDVAFADLDGASGGSEMTIDGAILTLNVDRIDSPNALNQYDGTMHINGLFSRLNVQLNDPDDSWTMDGELNLNGSALPGTLLDGSDIRVTGTINVDGISWVSANLDVEGTITLADASAELGLSSGPHIFRNTANVTGPGTLDVRSQATMLIENGAEIDVDVENRGRLEPGTSVGAATIDGSFLQTGGATFAVELGGLTPGTEFDQLTVTGTADLAGTLEVSLADAGNGFFVPEAGDFFTVLTAVGGLVDEFTTHLLPSNVGGQILDWQVIYPANSVVVQLLAISGLLGDYNGNGVVDAADYVVWSETLGSQTALAADGNQNGVVDPGDYDVWAMNFGMTAGSGFSARATVPEPAGVFLLIVGAAMGARNGFRRASRVPSTQKGMTHASNRPFKRRRCGSIT